MRFIQRFLLDLVHTASLLGQVANNSWNPQRVNRLNFFFFTSGIWRDSWASFGSCVQSNILPSMAVIEVWRATVCVEGKGSRKKLRNSGDTKLTVFIFFGGHFFVHFLYMCVIKQPDDPLKLNRGPQSVSPNKANILNPLQTELWPFFWAHFYRKPSVLKSHSLWSLVYTRTTSAGPMLILFRLRTQRFWSRLKTLTYLSSLNSGLV